MPRPRRRLRAQLERDLDVAQQRLEAAERARDTTIATVEQAATRGTTPRGAPRGKPQREGRDEES
jgi:hypothetical protein